MRVHGGRDRRLAEIGWETWPISPADDAFLAYDFLRGSAAIRSAHATFLLDLISRFRLDSASPDLRIARIIGFSDCVADAALNMPLRGRRADAVRQFLLTSGAAPKNVGPSLIDPSASPPGDDSPGLGRDLMRSVRLVVEKSTSADKEPPDTRHRFRVVAKSFIRTIGTNTGTLRCNLTFPPDPLGLFTQGKLITHARILDGLPQFPESASDDSRDQQYRLFSKQQFTVRCVGGKPVSVTASIIDTDNGPEAGVDTDPLIVFGNSTTGGSGGPLHFIWTAKGRPANAAELGFQAVCPRSSIFIWHHVEGDVDCNGVTITASSGSHFPTHRVFVDGAIISTIPQGEYASLWRGSSSDPFLVE